jgi:hypothetical protein
VRWVFYERRFTARGVRVHTGANGPLDFLNKIEFAFALKSRFGFLPVARAHTVAWSHGHAASRLDLGRRFRPQRMDG